MSITNFLLLLAVAVAVDVIAVAGCRHYLCPVQLLLMLLLLLFLLFLSLLSFGLIGVQRLFVTLMLQWRLE